VSNYRLHGASGLHMFIIIVFYLHVHLLFNIFILLPLFVDGFIYGSVMILKYCFNLITVEPV